MKLGVVLPYAEGSMTFDEVVEFVRAAEELDYDTVWVPEAWSFDAFGLLAALAQQTTRIKLATGIVNVFSRTPAQLGQSAATLDALSDGRAVLGLGASGPQVIEGWHGIAYDKPLARTRETIDIVRTILRRERLEYDGEIFQLGKGTLNKGLKLLNHPVRDAVPIYLASLGPRNVALTAERADGWLPVLFSPFRWKEVFGDALEEGLTKRSEELEPLEITPSVTIGIADAPEAAAMVARFGLALYIGGMGSRQQNFYNRLVQRYGYVEEAKAVQELYLGGDKAAAAEQVTDEMITEFSAIGPEGHVREQLAAYRDAGCSGLMLAIVAMTQQDRLEQLEAIRGLV